MTPIKGSEIANICLVKVMAYNSGGQTGVSTELWGDNSRTSRTNEYDRGTTSIGHRAVHVIGRKSIL